MCFALRGYVSAGVPPELWRALKLAHGNLSDADFGIG